MWISQTAAVFLFKAQEAKILRQVPLGFTGKTSDARSGGFYVVSEYVTRAKF